MIKEELSSQAAKFKFVDSIYNWLMRTLDDRGNSQYKDCFQKNGSSIMCHLPHNYFDLFEIPDNMVVEMKFVVKKN